MAFTGVLRPGLIQLRVLDMAEALKHYVEILGLDEVSREADGRVYLKGWDEFDHHSVVLREASEPGIDFMGFKVDTEENLKRYEQKINDWGLATEVVPAGEQPTVGQRIACIVPSGHRIELYADIAPAEQQPDIKNPEIHPQNNPPHGMGVTRFDHALLYGPDVEKVQAFFVEALDFVVSEQVLGDNEFIIASFLSCSNKAHDIAFIRHEEPNKFHHAGFHLHDWSEIGRAADIITHYDVSLDIGPTRHGITRGQTIYFFDPSGNRNEVFASGYTFYPDNPIRVWDKDQIGKGIFYHDRRLNERFLTALT